MKNASEAIRLLLLIVVMASSGCLYGQEPGGDFNFFNVQPGVLNPDVQKLKKEKKWFRHTAIGISGGTKGLVGVEAALQIVSTLNLRVGYHHLNFQLENISTEMIQRTFDEMVATATFKENNLEALVEWGFANGIFRLSGGVAYSLQREIHGDIGLPENYQFNDVVLSRDEVGSARGTWTYPSMLSPYLGIGLGRTIPERRVSFTLDIGTYYKGRPTVAIDASGIFRHNEENEPILNQNISRGMVYEFWPVVAAKIAVRIF